MKARFNLKERKEKAKTNHRSKYRILGDEVVCVVLVSLGLLVRAFITTQKAQVKQNKEHHQ